MREYGIWFFTKIEVIIKINDKFLKFRIFFAIGLILVVVEEFIASNHILNILAQGGIDLQSVY